MYIFGVVRVSFRDVFTFLKFKGGKVGRWFFFGESIVFWG